MENKIYTHDIAAQMVELFEDLLYEKGITVPCADEDEESERSEDGNEACLYGMEYSTLLDNVEEYLINALDEKAQGAEVVKYEFSGTI